MDDMSVGKIVDMTNDDFLKFIVNLPHSELVGLKKLLEVNYMQAVQVKDGLITALKSEKIPEKMRVIKKNLEDVYAVLFVLENKCSIAQTIIMKNEGGMSTNNGLDKD